MPVEPPPSVWRFPPPTAADEHGIVAVGADLEPGTLLHAYRHGMFPMPLHGARRMGWWSPDPRGVIPVSTFRTNRSLRRSARRYEIRVDTSFAEVVAACADPARPGGWITADILGAYERLHRLGWAHSIEAWDDDGLAGGLYGVALGGLFAGESMFHRRTDASKAAVVGAVELLRSDGIDRLFDVQWTTDHLTSIGAVDVPRATYLDLLAEAVRQPLPAIWR
jgi:leucyl/phenylalanyl-tRNA--protein transferase